MKPRIAVCCLKFAGGTLFHEVRNGVVFIWLHSANVPLDVTKSYILVF